MPILRKMIRSEACTAALMLGLLYANQTLVRDAANAGFEAIGTAHSGWDTNRAS
jgi:hypothetical protein